MVSDAHELLYKRALLAEAAFSDFAHDQPVVGKIAERLFEEAETTASSAELRHILRNVVDVWLAI